MSRARSRVRDTSARPAGDDSNLISLLDQALQGEAKRKKRHRTARELAGAAPDVLDGVLDLVQHLWP